MKHKKIIAAGTLLGVGLILSSPVKAIPGLPQIVWDPTTVAEVVKDIAAVMKVYAIEQESLQAYRNAQSFFAGGYKYQWRGIVNQTVVTGVRNTYGETAGWAAATATGNSSLQAWSQASLPVTPSASTQNDRRALADLASVETMDGAGITALQAHGESIAQQQQMARQIASLQTAAASGEAGDNTEAKQLNILTSGTVQSLRMQQTGNRAALASLALQTAQVKAQRDQIANHLQFEADVDRYGQTEGMSLGHVSTSMNWTPK